MLELLDSYALLGIVPTACAPIQLLYLKAGRRYDIGAVMYVAAGAFVGALVFPSATLGERSVAMNLVVIMLTVCFIMSLLRVYAIQVLSSMSFTLIALGQMWATIPLVAYLLQREQHYAGVFLGEVFASRWSLLIGLCVAVAMASLLLRLRLPHRLRAFTDSPEAYSVLMGSPLRLAVMTEAFAATSYILAGFLYRLSHQNLAPEGFGSEAIWMLLAVAAAPSFRVPVVVAMPLAMIVLRLVIRTAAPATAAALYSFMALAVILGLVAFTELRRHRVARS